MSVTVVVPFRGGQVDREVAFAHTCAHLRRILPGARLIVADTERKPFNRSGARNAGVREAGSGIVVVCDADSLPEREPVEAAIEAAADGLLHLPYTIFTGLTREQTLRVLLQGHAPAGIGKPELVTTNSVGGALVIDHDAYWEAGGQDEGFHGWGGEDVAFRFACDSLLGPTERHDGVLYGLWHPSEMNRTSQQYRRNIARENRYRGLRLNPRAMRKLIAER
jgi:glycosyltransferase involved in cell wall biosynthesis